MTIVMMLLGTTNIHPPLDLFLLVPNSPSTHSHIIRLGSRLHWQNFFYTKRWTDDFGGVMLMILDSTWGKFALHILAPYFRKLIGEMHLQGEGRLASCALTCHMNYS